MAKGKNINYNSIGIIHTPFKVARGTPIQSIAAGDIDGTVEVFPEFSEGLQDLDGFSHIILLYDFHKAGRTNLIVTPFMDDKAHGIFSTRAPNRPNPIGFSVVRLVRLEMNIIYIKGLDIIDGTPLLDIKPFVPELDHRDSGKKGWLQKKIKDVAAYRDDGRFTD